MPRYLYTALAGGETVTSRADAASLPALAAKLQAQGAVIQRAREETEVLPRVPAVAYFDIIAAYRQTAASIDAGLPLTATLDMLATESRNGRLKYLLHALKSQVAEGIPLSQAMSALPSAFPAVHVAIVRAGEESGRLSQALSELADQAEAFSNMNRRFASALVYPVVISFAALTLLSFGLLSFIPRFSTLFGDLGITDLPTITRLVLFLAGRVFPIVGLTLVGVLVLGMLILTQRRAASGRMWLDRWKLRIPGVGQIVEKAAMARFSGTLGLLLEEGVPLPDAVRLAAEAAGNRLVEHVLKGAATKVELGKTLGEAVSDTGVVPQTVAWRIGVGEESGTLPDSLTRLSRLYAGQVDSLVTSLAGLLEPTLIIILGAGIACVVLGMFLPLISVIQCLSSGGS